MAQIIPTQGNSQQVILQTPTAAELNAVAQVPEADGGSRSVGVVIPATDALTKNKVTLDKYTKNRLPHQGFKENAVETDEGGYKWTVIEDDNGNMISAWGYVAPETRSISDKYAATVDNHILTDNGDFTIISGYQYVNEQGISSNYYESVKYEGNFVSTSGPSALIQPVPALAADEGQMREIDMHYRKGEDLFTPIDAENYLSRAGVQIKTSETFLG